MKKFAAIIIAILILFYLPSTTKSNTLVVHEGESIQAAINAAMPGDTILVIGTFHENIVINKSITLTGKNARIYGINGSVIKIESKNVTISNISISHSDAKNAVVLINGSAVIENCIISYGRYGIMANGKAKIEDSFFTLLGSGIVMKKNVIIQSCNFTKCGIGMECYGSGNIIRSSTASACGAALVMQNASNNVVERCHFYRNNNNEADVFMLSSSNNVFTDCEISYSSFGVRMMNCSNNEIYNCSIHDARYGVEMEQCNDCYIHQSNIIDDRFGITLIKCRGIKVNYNNLRNKMKNLQARFSTCDARHNYWGSVVPSKIKNQLSIIRKAPWLIHPIGKIPHFKKSWRMAKEKQCIKLPHHSFSRVTSDDFDPLVDIKTIFIVRRVRSMDGGTYGVTISIDGMENSSVFHGDVWKEWRCVQNVDDSKQIVEIGIKIGKEERHIHYDLATGNWYGDDWLNDSDGYGHIIMKKYEIWFDVTYNDYDNDGLTYWEEVNIYHTSPYVNNAMEDDDNDGIPLWWEDKYGFDGFKWNNHSIDYDNDGLTDLQEYYMYSNLSSPFAKDIFLEIDYMPDYKPSDDSIRMLCNAFAAHDITIHVFVSNEIPLKERLYYNDLVSIYWKYFLNNNINSMKHGIFHYEVMGKYSSLPRGGHAFVGWDNLDSFMLGGAYIDEWRVGEARKVAYASLSMHELGHTLGLFEYTFPGIDNESCNAPWLPGYWIYRNYRSCLNYRYAFQLVDYSDGTHGRNDFDDWDNIDLTFFRDSYYYP